MLRGKTALVTGSTSGICLGIAEALAAAGANVVLNGFGAPDETETTRRTLSERHGVTVHYVGADMTQQPAIEAMMQRALAEFGSIDLLVRPRA